MGSCNWGDKDGGGFELPEIDEAGTQATLFTTVPGALAGLGDLHRFACVVPVQCDGLWAAIVTVGIFVFLRSVMRVRVLEDQEPESGLDLPVHGEEAYA